MSYHQAFFFSLLLYGCQVAFYMFGSMAFVKYLLRRD